MEALRAATIVPARVMKVDTESGSVEVGKRADLDILDANPLDDIHNIRTVTDGAGEWRALRSQAIVEEYRIRFGMIGRDPRPYSLHLPILPPGKFDRWSSGTSGGNQNTL
jgi:hypothetical protein